MLVGGDHGHSLSVTPIRSLLITDLAGPAAEVIDRANVLVLLPVLLRRVHSFGAHASHHAHFGPVGLCFSAIDHRQQVL